MSRPLALISLAALALTACVDDNADSGLTVLRNVAPATGCIISPDSTDFRSSGIIESSSTQGYLLTPLARNDLALADGETISQKIIFVGGAHVTVDFYDDTFFTAAELDAFKADGLTRFAVPSSGAIDPNGGTATFSFEVVPAELLVAINAKLPAVATGPAPSTQLNIGVQIYGTRSGSSISSNVFHYPVEVCNGCLVHDVGVCSDLSDTFVAAPGGACNEFQDEDVDCCSPAAGQPATTCPAVKPVVQT